MGVARLRNDVFPYLEGVSGLTHALYNMLRSGHNICYVIYEGRWGHFSTKEEIDSSRRLGWRVDV